MCYVLYVILILLLPTNHAKPFPFKLSLSVAHCGENTVDVVTHKYAHHQKNPKYNLKKVMQNVSDVVPPSAANSTSSVKNSTQELAWRLSLTAVLVLLSALFSGLTLGVLGLDTLSLDVIATSAPQPDRSYAQVILPLRKNGNQLLCTLLLGNVMTNVLISLLTDRLTSGISGFCISTAIILLVGEIIPQAVCSRYALFFGAKSVPLVNFFIVLLYVVAKPISLLLDLTLGNDPGQIYDRNMLRKLISVHAKEHSLESGLNPEEFNLMAGAMDFQGKMVKDCMTPIQEVFALSVDTRLQEDVMMRIWEVGYSRIPVYEGKRSNIVGIIFVKDLLFWDADDRLTLGMVLRLSSKSRHLHFTFEDTKLCEMLKRFSSGRTHLALVQQRDRTPPLPS